MTWRMVMADCIVVQVTGASIALLWSAGASCLPHSVSVCMVHIRVSYYTYVYAERMPVYKARHVTPLGCV